MRPAVLTGAAISYTQQTGSANPFVELMYVWPGDFRAYLDFAKPPIPGEFPVLAFHDVNLDGTEDVVIGWSVGVITYFERDLPTTCTDGLHDGDETGVDCGGSCGGVCRESLLPAKRTRTRAHAHTHTHARI